MSRAMRAVLLGLADIAVISVLWFVDWIDQLRR
jgi:hypothetical protein